MAQTIQDNAQKYLKIPQSPVLAMMTFPKVMRDTMQLYWHKVQQEGFCTDFCGTQVKLRLNSTDMPAIKFSTSLDSLVGGEYNSDTNTILLNTNLINKPQALYTTLIHEVTHAIQARLIEEKDKYTPGSVEHSVLTVMQAEGNNKAQTSTWQGIDFGSRIYCFEGMECKDPNQVSHLYVNLRASSFYNMLETERQARRAEIEWAKLSGICSPTFIAIQEENYNSHIEKLQDIFETKFLSKRATLSAFQYAQLNLATQTTPNKNKVAEIDMTYELAQMSALFNKKITLQEYNDSLRSAAKEQFCTQRNFIANIYAPDLGTIPIIPSISGLEKISKIPIQAPSTLALALMKDSSLIHQASNEQLSVLFEYINQKENKDYKERLEEVFENNFHALNQKYLSMYQKLFMTVEQMEQHYTSNFSFDFTGKKTFTNSDNSQNIDSQSFHQDR